MRSSAFLRELYTPMRRRLPIPAALLIVLAGCNQKGNNSTPSSTASRTQSQQLARHVTTVIDEDDVLIRHLERRISDLSGQVSKLNDEILKHDNACLEEEIAMLEGRPYPHKKSDPVESARELQQSLTAGLELTAQNLLDSEAAIQAHNRKHPDSPWASVSDLIRELCGDCTKERAVREQQLAEEAKSDAQSGAVRSVVQPAKTTRQQK